MSWTFNPPDLHPFRSEVSDPLGLTWDQIDTKWQKIMDAFQSLGDQVDYLSGIIAQEFVTGDVKHTFRNDVIPGWLLCDHRTFGSVASNSIIIGDIYLPLYEFIWNFAVDADLLTSAGGATTKGVSADADWTANKRLYLPDARGRVLVASGLGSGLTNRLLGDKFGAEYYTDNRTYGISAIAVSGSTPAITWTPSITIPALAIVNTVTASITNSAIVVSGGALSGAPSIGSLAVSPVVANITNPNINVSGGVLSGAISNGSLAVSAITGGVLSGSVSNGTLAVTPAGGGVLSGAPGIGTLAVSTVTVGIGSLAVSAVTINGTGGAPGNIPLVLSCPTVHVVSDSGAILVYTPTITGTVSSIGIASTLIPGGGVLSGSPSVSGGILSGAPGIGTLAVSAVTGGVMSGSISNGTLAVSAISGGVLSGTVSNGTLAVSAVTATMINPTISVSGGVLSGAPGIGSLSISAITASMTNPAITIGGTLVTTSQVITPSLTVPSTALSGVTASGTTQSNSVNIPTLPPSLVANLLVKI